MTFAKIGMFTIGGGYAMIPLIEREIVKKRWMSKEDFMEMFALTQSLPGVFAVNISIFVGYKLHKVKGSLVCALATILPSFVIMMLIRYPSGSSRTDCDTLHFGCTGTEAEVLATGASSHRHHTHLAIRAIPRIHCPCRNCRRNALYIMVKR